MAQFILTFTLLCSLAYSLMSKSVISQTPLDSSEQESVYRVLDSINSDTPWRTLFPDDLCISAPHSVVCDYFSDTAATSITTHITELSFGFVSVYSPNLPCNGNSTLDPSLLSPLCHLKKLFFYKCFTQTKIAFPDFSPLSLRNLEELVFIENPALLGSLSGKLNNLTNLRSLTLTGTSVSGTIPNGHSELVNLEQLTLSRNKFKGRMPYQAGLTLGRTSSQAGLTPGRISSQAGLTPCQISSQADLNPDRTHVNQHFFGMSGRFPDVDSPSWFCRFDLTLSDESLECRLDCLDLDVDPSFFFGESFAPSDEVCRLEDFGNSDIRGRSFFIWYDLQCMRNRRNSFLISSLKASNGS